MQSSAPQHTRLTFAEELRQQRWDDHRFYHQSRVTQSLHLFSALCFLITYGWLLFDPIPATIFGWTVAMWSRQIGHFFFEPEGFDEINDVSFDHKERVKVGFNLRRKMALLSAWLAVPVILWIDPEFLRVFPESIQGSFVDRLGTAWFALGVGGLLLRTLWLCVTRGVQTGAVWFTKILTDPLHDVKIYHSAPLWLWRGQWMDPMDDVRSSR